MRQTDAAGRAPVGERSCALHVARRRRSDCKLLGARIRSSPTKLTLSDLTQGCSVVRNGQHQGDARIATYLKVVKNPSP